MQTSAMKAAFKLPSAAYLLQTIQNNIFQKTDTCLCFYNSEDAVMIIYVFYTFIKKIAMNLDSISFLLFLPLAFAIYWAVYHHYSVRF